MKNKKAFDEIEDIEIWRSSCALAKHIYKLSNKGNFRKDYSLKDQIRRCAVSIPSNIAEGFGRQSKKEFIKFLYYSKGSLQELKTQLYLAKSLDYINSNDLKELKDKTEKLTKQIGSLIGHLK